MPTIYRPPFDPYCERQEAQDPNPALRSIWDGCWAWTLARAIDGATNGATHNLKEADVRAAAGVLDRAGVADGGTLSNQVTALLKLAPGLWYSARPTLDNFRAHLAAGGIAVLGGWESNAPISDRAYDPAFYDRTGANGHSIYVQGVGDGLNVFWGNPERFFGMADPIVSIDAAVKFVWAAPGGTVEALLLRSFFIPDPTPPYQREGEVPTATDPIRVLDTRKALGLSGPLVSHIARTFKVAGTNGIPEDVTIIVGNLTVTKQTSGGFLSVGPTPHNDPTSSKLNFPIGDDRANECFVAVGPDGTIAITYVGTGDATMTAHAIFDVEGWFQPAPVAPIV